MNDKYIYSNDVQTIQYLKTKLNILYDLGDECYFDNDNSCEFDNEDLLFLFTNSLEV